MKLLRRVLYWDAAVWAVSGVALALAPSPVLHRAFDQVALPDYAWVRLAGIEAVGLAMLMVLVAHRIEDLWWFSWAFVLAEGGIAVLALVHALVGLPEGSSALLWWLIAGLSGAFAAALLFGLARTGLERQAS